MTSICQIYPKKDMSEWYVQDRNPCGLRSKRREHKAEVSALRSICALMHAATDDSETNRMLGKAPLSKLAKHAAYQER